MHTLHIPAWYKTTDNPVLGNFFEEQVRALMKADVKCGVLFPNLMPSLMHRFRTGPLLDSMEAFDDDGLFTVRLNQRPVLPALRFSRTNLAFFRRQVLQAFDRYTASQGTPDLLHAHGVYMGGIAAEMIRQKHGIPFLNTEQFTGILIGELPNHQVFGEWLRTVFREASKTIVCSSAFKDELQTRFGFAEDHFVIVPNMVRDDFFADDIPATNSFTKKRVRLLNIAYLHPKKNQKMLIDAMQLLRQHEVDVSLRIAGDGILQQVLEKQIDDLGLGDRVQLLGRLSRDEVVREVRQCDVVVLTSVIETFGVCLIEGLANGKPVVATDSIGPRDIVNDNNGKLVPQGSTEDFANAVRDVIENYERYDPAMIVDQCRSKYASSVVSEQLQSLYEKSTAIPAT